MNNENVKERGTIKQLLNILISYKKSNKQDAILSYNSFHMYYEDKIGHYFGFIYQVLIFIKDAEEYKQIIDSKKYAHLFRSLFSKSELSLLAYHCLGNIGSKKFKKLVEYFEFFEHLPVGSLDNNLVLKYNKSVFGNSNKWDNLIEKLKYPNQIN